MIGTLDRSRSCRQTTRPSRSGRPEVEQHEIALVGGERSGPGVDQVDLETFTQQTSPQRLGDGGIVLDDQEAHGHMFARKHAAFAKR